MQNDQRNMPVSSDHVREILKVLKHGCTRLRGLAREDTLKSSDALVSPFLVKSGVSRVILGQERTLGVSGSVLVR